MEKQDLILKEKRIKWIAGVKCAVTSISSRILQKLNYN